jgi:hypothetical protein
MDNYYPSHRGYYDSVAETRYFQRNPHLPTLDGSIAIPDVPIEKLERVDDPSELEFEPQDKTNTWDYRDLTEQDKVNM